MVYVVLSKCFLKVPVGAMPESFGGEYFCLFGDRLWDDHIVVLLIHELGHLIRKPHKGICVILAPTVALVQQVSYYLSCWFCNLIVSFGLYLSLRQYLLVIWLVHCTIMKWCALWLGWGCRYVGCEKQVELLLFSAYLCNFSLWF